MPITSASTCASVAAVGAFVYWTAVSTGKEGGLSWPCWCYVAGLVYLAAALCAAGRPSDTQAGLCAVALLAAAGAPRVWPDHISSANQMCGAAAGGVALVLARSLVGNTALLAAGLDGRLRPVFITLLPTKLVVLIYSASRSSYMGALAAGRYGPFDGAHHPVEALGLRFRNDLGSASHEP
jgi:hypothetical protein